MKGMKTKVFVVLSSLFPGVGANRCEPWCADSCMALNGNVQIECGSCAEADGKRCFPGAPGYESWEERANVFRASVDANGQVATQQMEEDGVIERTPKSVVYEAPYYEMAQRRRTEASEAIGAQLGEPLPVPQASPRECSVHACVLIEGDDACADGRPDCTHPLGHLRQIGDQYEHVENATEVDVLSEPFDAQGFWSRALSKSRPLVLRGGTSAATSLESWSDDALLKDCNLTNGAPWHVLVEKQNRITQNDRHPLVPLTFCQFLESYRKPEFHNMLYAVNALPKEGYLRSRLGLPSALQCDALYHALHDARLWMSLGNTTSSLHFDTHENILMQIDGTKDVLLWHPNAVRASPS